MLGKLHPRNSAFQRRAKHLCPVDHTDAVGNDQICLLHGLHGLAVLPAGLHDLWVGRYNVMGAVRVHQAHTLGYRLLHGYIIKAHAQYIDSHVYFSFFGYQSSILCSIAQFTKLVHAESRYMSIAAAVPAASGDWFP